jgi:hypothetical protein
MWVYRKGQTCKLYCVVVFNHMQCRSCFQTDNSNLINTHNDQSTGSKTISQVSELPNAEEVPKGVNL